MKTRTLLGTTALVLLVASAGCLGALTSDTVSFEASKATVSANALADTGYQERDVTDQAIERDVEVAGQSKHVTITNWLATYEKSVTVGDTTRPAAAFAAVSTPAAKVAGQSLNPVASMSNEQLLEQFQSQFSQSGDVRTVDTTTVTMLGEETTSTKFATTTTVQGQPVDVFVHVAKVQHGDDVVVAIHVYPQALDDAESGNFERLVAGIDH
ncbi:DUF6517 family protein [Halobacteriaceae archaeon GCM10025711]